MMLPPLPSPKSYHLLISVFTLNDASVSSLSGDLYQRLLPCCFGKHYICVVCDACFLCCHITYGFKIDENPLIWWMDSLTHLYTDLYPFNIFSTKHSPKEKTTIGRCCPLNFSFGLLRFCWECIMLIINMVIFLFIISTKKEWYYRDSSCSLVTVKKRPTLFIGSYLHSRL